MVYAWPNEAWSYQLEEAEEKPEQRVSLEEEVRRQCRNYMLLSLISVCVGMVFVSVSSFNLNMHQRKMHRILLAHLRASPTLLNY